MLTPTQLIFKAYQSTPKPLPLPNGKTAEWPLPEMHEVPDELCWLCGGRTDHFGRLRKDAVRDSFTDARYARVVESESLCSGCGWILAQKFIRNWSLLVVDGKLEHPSRDQIREVLVQPPTTYPWLLSIAVSGQKHISFAGKVVLSPNSIWVLLEQTPVQIPPSGIGTMLEPIEDLYTAGFAKAEIQTGRYQQNRIRKAGLSWWRAKEELIAPLRGSRVFELAVFAAQKQERKGDDPCCTASIPTTKTLPSRRSVSTQSTGAEIPEGSKSRQTSGASSSGRSAQQQSVQQLFLFG